MNTHSHSYQMQTALSDDASTRALGARLAPLLKAGDVICLTGDLGAGKTTVSRGLIMALTDATEVPSPTYTLLQSYEADEFEIWHFDLYRLEAPKDIWALGIEDALDMGVCLIEWPERLETLKPDGTLDIDIWFDDEGRVALLSGNGHWGERLKGLDI